MALKSLNTLVKLHKRRVDVIRREMIALEEQRKQLLQTAATLREELLREMKLSTEQDPKMAGFFGAYSKRVKERLEKLAAEVKRLDGMIEEKAEAIREEFSEQKKYEIAREHAQKRQDAEVRGRLQQRFDEIGVQQYLKLKDNPV